jgi:hypothetical protein
LTLDYSRLEAATIPIGTGWLLGACIEACGKQDLWVRLKPEVLAALRNQAMIQSGESSNWIERVTVLANRLGPLVLGGAKPRDRSGFRRNRDSSPSAETGESPREAAHRVWRIEASAHGKRSNWARSKAAVAEMRTCKSGGTW